MAKDALPLLLREHAYLTRAERVVRVMAGRCMLTL